MRKAANGYIFILFLMFPLLSTYASEPKMSDHLKILNLESKEAAQFIDVWKHNILDSEQSIKCEIIDEPSTQNLESKVIRIEYDVESSNSAMVGMWIKLQNQNLSDYEFLHISLRSGSGTRFGGNLAVQFKDVNNRKSAYLITNITKEWRDYTIPLRKFGQISDWSGVKDFEVIIDDINARPKVGILFIDQIYVD